MGVIEKLRKKEGFTSAESSLADYIIDHLDTVYYMSLQDLAKASYVSKPSVIRLYRKIGCSSYREFSVALQVERINRNGGSQIENGEAFSSTATINELAEKVGVLSKQVVDNCIKAIEEKGLDDIVHVINEADNVYLYADEEIELEVRSFNRRMYSIGMSPIMINDVKDPDLLIASFRDEDVVIVASSSMGSEENKRIRRLISDSPALKILITTQNDPECHFDSDYTFFTYPNGNDFVRNNIFVSQMSMLLGLNIIQISLDKIRSENN